MTAIIQCNDIAVAVYRRVMISPAASRNRYLYGTDTTLGAETSSEKFKLKRRLAVADHRECNNLEGDSK
jgi:hypothetical protein